MRSAVNIFIVVFFAAVNFSSCKREWYEKEPDGETIILDSLRDFERMLNNNIMYEGTPALGEIASDGHYILESSWQILESSKTDANTAQGNAYTWSKDWGEYQKVADYGLAYSRIFYCNSILIGLDKLPPLAADEKKRADEVRGNALFHRAKNFLDLCQLYAPPNIVGKENSLGIVLKQTVDDPAEHSRQSTVSRCYSKIVEDLDLALDFLPATPSHKARVSRAAAFALLARAYLFMRDYDHAGIFADSCLNSGVVLMDYNNISADAPYLGRSNQEVLFYSEMTSYPIIESYSLVEPDLFALYDPADLRKSRFFEKNNSGAVIFKGNYTDNNYRFSGLATDEVYLIRAECHVMTRNPAEALRYLNELLRTRWDSAATYIPVTGDSAAIMNKILVERKKELLYRGLRWSDMRRLSQGTPSRQIGNRSYALDNSNKYTFPFPKDVLDEAPLIVQHPGW